MGTSDKDVKTIISDLTNQSFAVRKYEYDATIYLEMLSCISQLGTGKSEDRKLLDTFLIYVRCILLCKRFSICRFVACCPD
jgi:hypothetical protein